QVSSIMMRRQRTEDRPFGHCQNILSQYEQKEMVCPLCNKHFLGLAALQTHVASTHNVREGPDKKMKTYERSRKAMIASIATTTLGQVINHRHMCVWCKELHVDEESLQRHVESTHSSEGSDGQELQATTRQVLMWSCQAALNKRGVLAKLRLQGPPLLTSNPTTTISSNPPKN
ncbi:unnamed protein product, partial [Timema podura]|nr:unnamed protein product [Timema podura]